MAAPILYTPAQWAARIAGSTNEELSLLVEIYNQLYALSGGAAGGVVASIFWAATAGDDSYDAAQVPTLANMVGKTILQVTVDGGVIAPGNYTWDDTDFVFNPSLGFAGGEVIVVFFQV